LLSIDVLQARLCKLLDSTLHLRRARRSIYNKLFASRDRLKSLLTRVLPYTGFTFAAPESIYIYIYISHQDQQIFFLSVPLSQHISLSKSHRARLNPSRTTPVSSIKARRVSRSRKITFNTCFAVYRIHSRHAQTSVQSSLQTYQPSIFSIAHDSILVVFRSPRHYGKFIIWGVPQSV
jgi:hypothetical protein